tara:strand:- start:448 stop:2286 length:1839 start_codon:yes stop_codon:yes gene_type:complete
MAFILANGKQQYFDDTGNPLSGGKLWTMQPGAGVTTPKATWIDAGETALNTNPIILNARGEAQVFWSGGYNVRLESATGGLIYTVENINIEPSAETLDAELRADLASTTSSKGAGLIGLDYAATYAAQTAGFYLKADEIFVGTNTSADSAALQTALTRNAGGSLAVVGTVLLTAEVSPADNTVLDLRKARIIDKNAINGYTIRAIGKTGITIIGGRFSPDPSIVTAVHPTGTYGSGSAIQFDGCTNCHVTQANISNFYGAVNLYNSSNCSARGNYLTDNAGGIQALADNTLGFGSSTVKGIDFSHNIILHSGDDGLSFLIGAGHTGTISGSRIAFNHVTKDVGIHGTVGQARGIALVSEPTSGANNVYGVEIIGNTGYYMGSEFIRATGVIRSTIAHNFVDGFAANGAVAAYTFGDLTTGAYGVQDCVLEDNRAINNLTNSQAVVIDGALRCKITNNFAKTTIAGDGAMRLDNSTFNVIRDNTMHNASAFGIKLAATSTDNDLYANDVSVAVAGISDLGARNYKENNIGWATANVGQAGIAGASTSVVVNHGINVVSSGRLRVRATPISPLYAGTEFYVGMFTTTQFTITMDIAPGGANTSFFQWDVYESRA